MWKSWKRRDLAKEEEKKDYDRYELSPGEFLICLGKSTAVTAAFTCLFYRSWLGFLALPPVAYRGIQREKQTKVRAQKERLALQFKDTILAVTDSMQAGYSSENAFLEAEGEIGALYGRGSEMAQELALIRKGMKNQVPLERMLLSLGERSHVEEIRNFSEVFVVAKRLGGNLREVMKRTSDLTQQKMEVEREIATLLASRKYEQKVMLMIPFLLFGYMQFASRGFFDILYHNTAGIAVMTVSLVLYLTAWMLAEKIMDIRI